MLTSHAPGVRWDLDAIFPGGSDSAAYAAHLDALEETIRVFRGDLAALPAADAGALAALIQRAQEITDAMRQAAAFASCLVAQDVKDENAKLLSGRVRQIHAAQLSGLTALDQKLLALPDSLWPHLLADSRVAPVAFAVEERRRRARQKMSAEQESLVNDLSVDGYHGWGELYNVIVSRITIPFEENGQTKQLSAGQAANRLASGDRAVREALWERWEQAWSADAELCAAALNHLGGYRLALYRNRGWDSVLQEPLEYNRMSEATLEAMWGAIEEQKGRLVAFLDRKARLLGLPGLAWHDVSAPLRKAERKVPYSDAASFITEHFRRFSPDLADFAALTFERNWIEAEDRPGKRPGGFCTGFPQSRQSRIFMTYSGTAGNVATLAHELGHAYHGHVLYDLPQLARNYAMNVAETASTFAELIVADAAIKETADLEERLGLLEDKIERSVAYFMNIHARFLFETEFYRVRAKGVVPVAQLNSLMETAQRKAFHDALGLYHPTFWASKLHFYLTTTPFYNFPYTFGYLFSTGIYAKAMEEGPGFARKYVDLLRDTARMRVEDLARRHLGADLTRPAFWQEAVSTALADVDEFLRLTEPMV